MVQVGPKLLVVQIKCTHELINSNKLRHVISMSPNANFILEITTYRYNLYSTYNTTSTKSFACVIIYRQKTNVPLIIRVQSNSNCRWFVLKHDLMAACVCLKNYINTNSNITLNDTDI